MKISKRHGLTWVIPLVLMSCATPQSTMFENAVNDAAVVDPADVYDNLVAVTPDNPALIWNADNTRVRVVMWKSRTSYASFYKDKHATDENEAYVTWVTTAPQVKTFAQRYLSQFPSATKDQIDLRLKQYLGLKPEWRYDLFIEMWVDPKDLFRPCPDPEIHDKVCNIKFSKTVPKVKGISCYPCFYKNLYFEDFRTRPGVPWTGMGYTYDWGNRHHPFGASEFILVPGAAYEIVKVVETMDYIKK
ncbi:MAG: hypothetical protein MI799_01760 [Desulfobacterales bacterium]|nr:hypothetical protein [Desulfobacterales bacterium]